MIAVERARAVVLIAPPVTPPPERTPREHLVEREREREVRRRGRRRQLTDLAPAHVAHRRDEAQRFLRDEVQAEAELATGEESAWLDAHRPRTREDCTKFGRPCPYVGCRHHNLLQVDPNTGAIALNADDVEDLEHSCSLDRADLGEGTLEDVSRSLNVTRERIRQLEAKSLAHLAAGLKAVRIRAEHVEGDREATNDWRSA